MRHVAREASAAGPRKPYHPLPGPRSCHVAYHKNSMKIPHNLYVVFMLLGRAGDTFSGTFQAHAPGLQGRHAQQMLVQGDLKGASTFI